MRGAGRKEKWNPTHGVCEHTAVQHCIDAALSSSCKEFQVLMILKTLGASDPHHTVSTSSEEKSFLMS